MANCPGTKFEKIYFGKAMKYFVNQCGQYFIATIDGATETRADTLYYTPEYGMRFLLYTW